MGFMDIFVKPEDGNQTVEQKNVSVQTPVVQQNTQPVYAAPVVDNVTNVSAIQNTAPVTPNSSEVNDEIVKQLYTTLLEKNLPGPDFIELVNSASALESMGLSEAQRYEAAFKMLKASYPNFTKDVLLNSIDTYIGFVNEELAEGKKQCQAKRTAHIGDKQTRIQQLKEQADNILAEISKMQQQHANILESVKKLETEVIESTTAIDKEEQIFNNSINVVINKLNADKAVMSTLNI